MELDVGHLEANVATAIEQGADQVLHDLLLTVDRDVPAGQPGHVDVMVATVVSQVDPGVLESLAVETLGDVQVAQDVDRVLLEQPGPHALLDVLARARLEHNALDSLTVEQHREREPSGPGADDANLGVHGASLFARWRDENHV